MRGKNKRQSDAEEPSEDIPSSPAGIGEAGPTTVTLQERPKVLLVDIAPEIATTLRTKGLNVAEGTFGPPYQTPVGDHLVPVIAKAALPGLNEQEVIVVDLTIPEPTAEPPGEKQTSLGTQDIWAKASHGLIDPRPLVMWQVRERCDRILRHGGVFIVFVQPRTTPSYVVGRKTQRYGFERDFVLDDQIKGWDFLTVLDESHVRVVDDSGREIEPDNGGLLKPYLKGATFSAVIEGGYALPSREWLSLAKNKYGEIVAAAIVPDVEDEAPRGAVFLFPQIEDKGAFLADLFDSYLPRVFPHLFPDSDELGWLHDREYELPRLVEISDEIAQAEAEHETRISGLREEAAIKQASDAWKYDLLRGTGDALVAAVRTAFGALGFSEVEDVDAGLQGSEQKREDLRIHDHSPLLLVEVKGISGTGKEAGSLQVTKYVAPRMRELERTDIQSLAVVNHQRNLAPRDRAKDPFQDDVLTNATEQQLALITGVDLFRLVRNAERLAWKHEDVADLFYTPGRVAPVPAHYELVGTLDGFWEQVPALGIKLTSTIDLGDRLAFELSIDFVEEVITSIQLENEQVSTANAGQHIATLTGLSKSQARKGVRVFRVRP